MALHRAGFTCDRPRARIRNGSTVDLLSKHETMAIKPVLGSDQAWLVFRLSSPNRTGWPRLSPGHHSVLGRMLRGATADWEVRNHGCELKHGRPGNLQRGRYSNGPEHRKRQSGELLQAVPCRPALRSPRNIVRRRECDKFLLFMRNYYRPVRRPC